MTSRSSAWGAVILVISAWGLAFSLAAHLTTSDSSTDSTGEFADWLLGESRQILSINFFNTADLYFHKGVGHRESSMELPGLFQYWQKDITPALHAHAEGEASAEILPWLKLATHADPHNVEAFLVASFWASTGLKRQDLALEILYEAQRLNPGDYRIALEKGRLAIATHRFAEAIRLFDSAYILHAHTPTTLERIRELALDKAEIMTFLGFLYEAKGDRQTAIQYFNKVLLIFPERSDIKERLGLLETGKAPPDSAQTLLEHITKRNMHDSWDEGHDHHDDDHDTKDHIE